METAAVVARTQRYRDQMVVLIRVARVALFLILAVIAVSLVIGMARSETGGVEKVVLAAMFLICLAVGAAVRSLTARFEVRVAGR